MSFVKHGHLFLLEWNFWQRGGILFKNFIYFWLHWVFAATHRTSLVAKSRGYSLVGSGYSLIVVGFSCCGAWALGHGFQQWWCMGLVALWHVEFSWTRDRTCVPSIGQKIFNCWITREVHMFYFSKIYFSPYVLL